MVKEMTLPFSYKKDKRMKFGILPRHATSDKDLKMFTAEVPMMLWHTATAWEDGDIIHLLVCGMADVSSLAVPSPPPPPPRGPLRGSPNPPFPHPREHCQSDTL